MEVVATGLPGAMLIKPRVFPDERGFFCETFRAEVLAEHGISEPFIQDNHSRSSRGVVRGLHFAIGAGSSKLVRCGRGTIWDVIVDLRAGSPTYKQWEGHELSDQNMHVLYVPVGFAHGFCVLSEVADVIYKQSAYYDPEVERGIAWNDEEIAVEWPLPADQCAVSERDMDAPRLRELPERELFRFVEAGC